MVDPTAEPERAGPIGEQVVAVDVDARRSPESELLDLVRAGDLDVLDREAHLLGEDAQVLVSGLPLEHSSKYSSVT